MPYLSFSGMGRSSIINPEGDLIVPHRPKNAVQEPASPDADSKNTVEQGQMQEQGQDSTPQLNSAEPNGPNTWSRESSPLSDPMSIADPYEDQDTKTTLDSGPGANIKTQPPEDDDEESTIVVEVPQLVVQPPDSEGEDEDDEESTIVVEIPPHISRADSPVKASRKSHLQPAFAYHSAQEEYQEQQSARERERTEQERWIEETLLAIEQIHNPSTVYTYNSLDECFAHQINPVLLGSQPKIPHESIDPGRDGFIDPNDTTRFQQPVRSIPSNGPQSIVSQFWVRPANMPFPRPPASIVSQHGLELYLYWCKCKRVALHIRAKRPSARVKAVVAELRRIDGKWQLTMDEVVDIEAAKEAEDLRKELGKGRRRSKRDERMGVDNLKTWF